MAGLKPAPIAQFYRALHARGQTLRGLAAAMGLQEHAYVSRLVNGHGRRRDGVWWPRLRALLTAEEIALVDPPTFPTLQAAVAALPEAPAPDLTFPPADNPVVREFIDWKHHQHQRRTA